MKKQEVVTKALLISLNFLAIGVAAWFPLSVSLAESTTSQASGTMSVADKAFVRDATCGSSAEVDLGQLAKDKGQNDAVRAFGQQMIDDHTKANKELADLAGRKGVAVTTELKPKHKNLKESLSKLSGVAFDKQYIREMLKEHAATIAAFEKEASQGKDTELNAWVVQTLPTLKAHLQMAREAEMKLKTDLAKNGP